MKHISHISLCKLGSVIDQYVWKLELHDESILFGEEAGRQGAMESPDKINAKCIPVSETHHSGSLVFWNVTLCSLNYMSYVTV